jgi:hypothetical protein
MPICLIGCNWAFKLDATDLAPPIDADRPDADPRADLDRDRLVDVEDPCIAPDVDLLVDSDDDMTRNGLDSCPWHPGNFADTDGDGIADPCDPFPTTGDRLRCLMALTDPDMNVLMWKPRELVTPPWILFNPRSLLGETGSISADWPFEATGTTTYDVMLILPINSRPRVQLLVRAAATPQATDVGCELVIQNNLWTFSIVPGRLAASTFPPFSTGGRFHVSMTIEPGNAAEVANVRCSVRVVGASLTTKAYVPLSPGHLGFATTEAIAIGGISVYERDDAPPL